MNYLIVIMTRNNIKKQADGFKELGGKQDTIAQNSMYLLGDSYLKLGNKPGARNAFLFCALNSTDKQQKEVSKFNYAKLSVELGYTDVALTELKNFISTLTQILNIQLKQKNYW